ncbi:Very-short-patch-repair endonuclease [Micromonospora cremea]|uniref:Very-short-patch-repair endonuclease n=2 Tax=Micromonospora cremea TaxID=709881 RepID=A0A1N5WGJ5_9ACTN|nr:Very-short-patch-repair endonuclease [Micromonospora cremea]
MTYGAGMAHPVRADGEAAEALHPPAVIPAWWAAPPPRLVSHLPDVDPEVLRVALDPLPPAAPAIVHYRPAVVGSLGDLVDALLDQLDSVALAMFPRWLPTADRLDGEGMLGVAAVRALAARAAARSRHFGPFLADLAERGLRFPRRPGGRSRFPAEVRAAGLARVIAEAYDREGCVLLVALPDLGPDAERTLVAAAEWLVRHSGFTVWLTGAPLRHADRIRSVTVTVPARFADLVVPTGRTPETATRRESMLLAWPPIAGVPRGDSAAEQALERALAPHAWARGRRWNQTYEWHVLGEAYRLDLFWPAEGLAVEVDGPEHRGPIAFANDRRRDVQLQLLGLDVLRFTNEQVLSDAPAVVDGIRRLLARRRADGTHPHGDETS